MSDVTLPEGISHLSACVLIGRGDLFAGISSTKHGGQLELPGGKAKPGESGQDCIRREVLEELGVELVSVVPIYQMVVTIPSSGQQHLCRIYAGRIAATAVLRDSPEGPAVWFTAEDILERGTYRDTVARPLLAYARHRAEADRADVTSKLETLLSLVHRDGGDYVVKHGLDRACSVAESLIIEAMDTHAGRGP